MFLDVAVGILGYGLSSATHTWLGYIAAICLVLLPDIDIIATRFPSSHVIARSFSGHRGVTHYPILYLFVVLLIAVWVGTFWGILSLCLFLWHFVHDTFFLGWGIVWGWPFSSARIKFFPDKDGKILPIPLLVWGKEDDGRIHQQFGTKNWIKRYYCSFSVNSVVEYGSFAIALLYMFCHLP